MNIRQTTIRREFFKYGFTLFMGIMGVISSYLIIGVLLINIGFLLPANYYENEINQREPNLKSVESVSQDMIPEGMSYAILDKFHMRKIYGNMDDQKIRDIKSSISGEDLEIRNGKKVIRVIERETEYCIVEFHMRPQFTSSKLRNTLPNYEIISLTILAILIITYIVLVTTFFAKKMMRNFKMVTRITNQIKSNNLDFEPGQSNIREIEEIIYSLTEMRDALKISLETQWKMERTKREQIGALAHDIKIPVTIIKGNSELLNLSNLSLEQRELNNYVIKAGNRIEEYVGTLIDISTMEDILLIEKNKINVRDFVQDIYINSMQAYINDKPIELVLKEIQLPNIDVVFDSNLLCRAIMNVLTNAVRYTPEGGQISFKIEVIPNFIQFTIVDNGKGFSAESLEKATELFYTDNKGRNSADTYGIGLTFVNNVVKLHGGFLSLQNDSRTGGGKVSINIPLKY